jgi:two-component SAPR family response regulator
MTQTVTYIVVDDDHFNNTICSMIIKKYMQATEVKIFTEPESGLLYFKEKLTSARENEQIFLFLDINMPQMSGWEFLEEFEKLSTEIKNAVKIYILSSSVNDQDLLKSKNNALVTDYIIKPLTREKVFKLLQP